MDFKKIDSVTPAQAKAILQAVVRGELESRGTSSPDVAKARLRAAAQQLPLSGAEFAGWVRQTPWHAAALAFMGGFIVARDPEARHFFNSAMRLLWRQPREAQRSVQDIISNVSTRPPST